VVIIQKPNLPLAVAAVFWLLQKLVSAEPWHIVFAIIYAAALSVWAALEIFTGVNWFRRGLGFVGLYFVVVTLINL
jgi:hypothetical protein